MNIETFVNSLNSAIWAMPVILLLLCVSMVYMIAMRFGTLTKPRLQLRLLRGGNKSSDGISPFETFCSVAAYRIAVGNIGGVCVAIMYGGPGAVLWMLLTSLITSALPLRKTAWAKFTKSDRTVNIVEVPITTLKAAWAGNLFQCCSLCWH